MNQRWLIQCMRVFVPMLACIAGTAHADSIRIQPYAVTASKSLFDSDPSYATDGDSSTTWNAGAGPRQWIQIDLGRTMAVRNLRLRTAQSPAGRTKHSIAVGPSPSSLTTVGSLSGYTSDDQVLKFSCGNNRACGNIRVIRVTTTQSPSWVAWKEIEIDQGIEYFGYYGDAFDWVGRGDYISETTASGSNLVWIAGPSRSLTAKLQEATSHKSKAVLVLANQLFDGKVLRQDWKDQWSSVAAIVKGALANSIAAFYPADEPISNGYALTDLSAVISRIRADFPSIPIAVIFSPDDMRSTSGPSYSALYDWIGFNCYGDWQRCTGVGAQSHINVLRSWLKSEQRMVAVPWAFLWRPNGIGLVNENRVIKVAGHWQVEVNSDPSYIAIFPFLWQSGNLNGDGIVGVGTRDLPHVRARMSEFAATCIGGGSRVYAANFSSSSVYADYDPFSAFDGDLSDMWNAGPVDVASVTADLGGSTRIDQVVLTVAQTPSGITSHVLEGLSGDTWQRLTVFTGVTTEGQMLNWTGSADISQLRVRTTQSPSWVAWHEIQIFRH